MMRDLLKTRARVSSASESKKIMRVVIRIDVFCDWIVVAKSFFIIHSRANADVRFTLSKTITIPSNSA